MPRPHYTRDEWGDALRALLEPKAGRKATSAKQRYWMLLGAAAEAAGLACVVTSDGALALFQPPAVKARSVQGDLPILASPAASFATLGGNGQIERPPPQPQEDALGAPTGDRDAHGVTPKTDPSSALPELPPQTSALFGGILASLDY